MIKRIESRPETIEACNAYRERSAVELEGVIDDFIRRHEEHVNTDMDYEDPRGPRPRAPVSVTFNTQLYAVDAVVNVVAAYKDAGWSICAFDSAIRLQW